MKARRVKCDETKPHCLRCQKFGRECDGYGTEPSQARGLIQLQPRIPSISLYGPSVSIHTTEEESRYFQVFSEHTAHELSGFYDPTFWTRLVLQESHNVPAIRHAAIALGAMNLSLKTSGGPKLKVNVMQNIDKRHHEQAVLAHLKAIQSLNNYLSSAEAPQLRNALIACLLFVCFETFQGSYGTSVQQIYGGLKILRSYYQGKPGSRPRIPDGPDTTRAISGHTTKVSNVLQTREGCDNVSRERAIAQHVEEYLQNESHSRQGVDDESHGPVMSSIQTKTPPRDPDFILRHMGGTEARYGLNRSTNMYSPTEPSQSARHFSDSMASNMQTPPGSSSTFSGIKRPPSGMSVSSPTTAANYTPPSTAPHTPSTTNPSAMQTSIVGRKRALSSRSPTPVPLLQNDLTIEEILIQSFVRLDGSGLFFGMVPGIPPLIWDTHKTWHLTIPSSFTDFPSAQRCWDFLMDRTLQFYRRTLFNRNYAPSTSDPPASINKQYKMHTQQLSTFATAFQPLLDAAIGPDGSIANAAALVLSLYQKSTLILIASIPSESEMIYDDFLVDFTYIVHTSARLVASQDSTQLPRNTRFSFDTGIVPPLHLTCSKCRDPIIRREAINILWNNPRQEGMWDGVLSARIGRWIAACEEDGLPPPPLPSNGSSPESAGEMSSYPSPTQVVEDAHTLGGWEDGRRMREVINEVHGGAEEGEEAYGPGSTRHQSKLEIKGGIPVRKRSSTKVRDRGKRREVSDRWIVPEENRVQLMVVDFHMPERFIRVKCQKAIPGADGKREQRETVIAW